MPPSTADRACQAAPSPSWPRSAPAIMPRSRSKTAAVPGCRRWATRPDITGSTSCAPLLLSGASMATTRLVPSGQGSTGPLTHSRDGTSGGSGLLPVKTFFTVNQGRADARQAAGRRGLDKGTLAAAHLGLERAGQRPPDRRIAYGPPPLVKPPAPSARECRTPVVQARGTAGRRPLGRRPQR